MKNLIKLSSHKLCIINARISEIDKKYDTYLLIYK